MRKKKLKTLIIDLIRKKLCLESERESAYLTLFVRAFHNFAL